MILDRVAVRSVERVSPSVIRFELGGDRLAEFGVDGPILDQRIKLIFPNAAGTLPSFDGMDDSWWTTWQQIPEDERGSIRTYTIRDAVGDGADTRLVVDIVVHEPAPGEEPSGAGNAWALGASVDDELIVLCPRKGHLFGGIEWAPGEAERLLIVGDETAAPAIRGILRDLPADARGAVFLETVTPADRYDDMPAPEGVSVTWLPRAGGHRGAELAPTVLAHLAQDRAEAALPEVSDDEIDPDLWETPIYSSSGEEVAAATTAPTDEGPFAGLYAWIAGESKVVTGLRRTLVKDLGLDRSQVAFMGYWREGVAMRS
ncbi:siderophore-interacting protein [Nocardioides sp. BGMRC 2183]|nr:siderophore-interacting protein [Nocardioides sp. BGMRC 2183]